MEDLMKETNFIYDFIEFLILEEQRILENFLKNLLDKGCECGNRNIKNFTLIYCEHKFKYVLCECCKRKHYVKGVQYGIC